MRAGRRQWGQRVIEEKKSIKKIWVKHEQETWTAVNKAISCTLRPRRENTIPKSSLISVKDNLRKSIFNFNLTTYLCLYTTVSATWNYFLLFTIHHKRTDKLKNLIYDPKKTMLGGSKTHVWISSVLLSCFLQISKNPFCHFFFACNLYHNNWSF